MELFSVSHIAVISLFGVLNCLFLSLLFVRLKKGNELAHRWLGFLFFLLAIRLSKLAVQTYASSEVIAYYFNGMHATWLGLGPTLLFYITYYRRSNQFSRIILCHYLPALLFLLLAKDLRITLGESIWQMIYLASLAHLLFYLSWALFRISKVFSSLSKKQSRWLFSIWGIVCLVWGANIAYYFGGFPFYLVTASISLVLLYLLTFLAFQHQSIYYGEDHQKYKNLKLNKGETIFYLNQLGTLIKTEQLHLNPNLKLSEVAAKLSISSHLLSRIINEATHKNFPTYINSFRVETAKTLLLQELNRKILAIAYDAGFHSLSAFNAAFRKNTGLSPSEFRRRFRSQKV